MLHLNEGHSGFAVFEAIRDRMQEEGLDFDTAARQIPREVVFTTHTPVPAGHDRFNADLIEEHLGPLREQLGISHENLMGFGREHPTDNGESFCMTVLGLKLSRRANAVCSLHGEVSRAMWTRTLSGPPGRRSAHRPHHQRRACALVAGAADVPALRPPSRRGLAAAERRSARPGRQLRTSTMANCGRRT